MAREKIDRFEARWLAVAPPAASPDLLPDHPWVGHGDLRETGVVEAGAPWVTSADLMVESVDRLPFRRSRRIALRGLASMARRLAVPVAASDLASCDLEPIRSGTELRLVEVSGWGDWNYPASDGEYLRFAVPDGRTFALTTSMRFEVGPKVFRETWEEGIEWWMLACAAVIVPAAHSFALNPALVSDALARIDTAASAAHLARVSMAATPAGV
jgi:hypothetical protein